ncbi:conserved hypothetical protein [Lausannevirus]|uniref:Peptidase S74 domain-containing protein n=2 Tax=Lausannevirus TaxID=999883 RepID=A0A0N9PZE1_9VIRU|nr:hypothetical protein LAU_0429 [Lausannevirus]AEA07279.1 conserved hypothetical protein [Lausannevirus]ALH07086.1 hypothetical protein PMV_388 [Port-miou virus]
MSSTINSVIKKEFVVSKRLFIPTYQNIASAPIPTKGSLAFDRAAQSIVVSNGINWQAPAASNATVTSRGIVYGTTSNTPSTVTGYGYLCGPGTGTCVYVGTNAGEFNIGAQTGLTFVGNFAGRVLQASTNKVMVGRGAGINDAGAQQNSVGIGSVALGNAITGTDNVAVGTQSQSVGRGSGNCSLGIQSLASQALTTATYNNCIAIGYTRLQSATTLSSGLIAIGTGAIWNPGATATDVVYIGNGTTIPANATNIVAFGSGTFAGAVVPNNTFAVADDITQLRSFGLSVSASANILQFDPVTGLVTQAASSRRFKDNIRELEPFPSLLETRVCTYDIDDGKDHGIIAEEVPEDYASFDIEGQRNGVKFSRIIMYLLSEIQRLAKEVEGIKQRQ